MNLPPSYEITHVIGVMDNLLSKKSSLTTSACKNFSIDVTTPKIDEGLLHLHHI
jgi:hypothetical protein